MKKNVTRFTLATLSIVLMLLLVTACGSGDTVEPTLEPPPVETPAPTPEPSEPEPIPEPAPVPVEDNRLGVDFTSVANNCPAGASKYEGDLFVCNLDNVLIFSLKGDLSNPEKLGVMFYASATNVYQNEQVSTVLNMLNEQLFYNGESSTLEILNKSLYSITNGFTDEYLRIGGYNIEIQTAPAQDGGGGVISYFVTK